MNHIKKEIYQLLFYSIFVFFANTSGASQSYPLAPPDLSSPQATIKSFLDIVRENRLLLEKDLYIEAAASLIKDENLEEQAELFFDYSNIPIERVEDKADYDWPLLIEILDRIELPLEEQTPDEEKVKSDSITQWTIPHTNITLVLIEEGPRQGQWVFSEETSSNLKFFYDTVKHLPYRSDAAMGYVEPFGGPYQRHTLLPEETFPDRWIFHLPKWAKTIFIENAVWKWLAVGLSLIGASIVYVMIYRLNRRLNHQIDKTNKKFPWWRLLPPFSGAILAHLTESFIDEQINVVGIVDWVSENSLWCIALIFWAWTIIELGNIVADVFVQRWKKDIDRVHFYISSIIIRICAMTFAAWIVLYGIERLGLSIFPLLAGLGVGGIAIALAIRPTLENMIGGWLLFIDKPVIVGDMCKFTAPGGQVKIGVVERIGLRSTRLRQLENTLLTIPNAEFSQLQIENLSSRDMTLMRDIIALRYETTDDQLRYLLIQIREMMIGHPMVSPEKLRVRFKGFGDSSLDVAIFANIRTATYPEYLAIREDINLRIIDIVKKAGTGFAFPSQTTYFAKDTGLDTEQTLTAQERVKKWRLSGDLPFPDFNPSKKAKFTDTLDYPPKGSSTGKNDG